MSAPGEILIVDDDIGTLETLVDVLHRRGHHIETADKGRAGLSRVEHDPPVDIAIVDFKLPDVSGVELLRSIKRRSAGTEVILMTGHATLASALEAIDGEVASYLVKPLDLAQLLAKVDKTLARQRFNRALRESEERHRLVTEHMEEAVFLLDLEGRVALANAAGEQLSGYDRHTLRGLALSMLLPHDAVRFIRKRMQMVSGPSRPPVSFDTTLLTRSGGRVGVSLSVSVAKDGRGHPCGASMIARDVTERRRGERVARAVADIGRNLLDTRDVADVKDRIVTAALQLFEGRRTALCEVDTRSETLRCVAAAGHGNARSFLGWELPLGVGIAGKAISERRVVQSLGPCADGEGAQGTGASPTAARPGSPGTAVNVAVPLTVKGETLGALLLGSRSDRAMSEQHVELLTLFADHAATALYNARVFEEQERLSRERSAALNALRDAQRRLLEAERLDAIGAVTWGASHYIRNVLQALLTRINQIGRRAETPEAVQLLDMVEASVLDTAAALRSLDAFAEPRAFHDVRSVDLNHVIRETVDGSDRSWAREAELRGLEVEVDFAPGEIPVVGGEPAALAEVISILLMNAVDALSASGRVCIRTWADEQSILCSVADAGTGMGPETRRRALDPFFTTKGSDRKGLGLSVAAGIVRRHGGRLEIESVEGTGTTVTFSLPGGR